MTFQEKIKKVINKFSTHAEKLAYIKGLNDGLEQGREILLNSVKPVEFDGVAINELSEHGGN